MPDLQPLGLWLEPDQANNAGLVTLVRNGGAGPSAATTVRFYLGDPGQGGILMGTSGLASQAPGQSSAVTVPWDTTGRGGDNPFFVVVDPVTEYDQTNNTAQAIIRLPRFGAGWAANPGSIYPGQGVTLSVQLENLQANATLPITASVEIRSPIGTLVYAHSWVLLLAEGADRLVTTVWQSDPGGRGFSQEVP